MGASGGVWVPPTSLNSGRKKSQNQLKRDAYRSEVRKLVRSKEPLEIEPSELATMKSKVKTIRILRVYTGVNDGMAMILAIIGQSSAGKTYNFPTTAIFVA